MMNVKDIEAFLASQPPIMAVLEHVAALNLPDSWVAAGFIRNAIWDELTGTDPAGYENSDVDVLYFDPDTISPEAEQRHEAVLRSRLPSAQWEVRNQARMHLRNHDAPYESTADAMCHWLETPTAIAARQRGKGVELLAPMGIEDLLTLTLRPTPTGTRKLDQFEQRLQQRNWQTRWPAMRVVRPH